MKILLTNDDGINAPGILALAKRISQIAEVTIVAPDRERSATAHAITMHKPLRTERTALSDCDATAWTVNGTPSDCVKLAVEAILDTHPDMVISGINRGYNLGSDVIYSGTVSAAIEASLLGVPALALSAASGEQSCFDFAARFAGNLCEQTKMQKFPKDILLNINVPCIMENDYKGVFVTHLGVRKYENTFEKRQDPRGKSYYWMAGKPVDV